MCRRCSSRCGGRRTSRRPSSGAPSSTCWCVSCGQGCIAVTVLGESEVLHLQCSVVPSFNSPVECSRIVHEVSMTLLGEFGQRKVESQNPENAGLCGQRRCDFGFTYPASHSRCSIIPSGLGTSPQSRTVSVGAHHPEHGGRVRAARHKPKGRKFSTKFLLTPDVPVCTCRCAPCRTWWTRWSRTSSKLTHNGFNDAQSIHFGI